MLKVNILYLPWDVDLLSPEFETLRSLPVYALSGCNPLSARLLAGFSMSYPTSRIKKQVSGKITN